MTLQTSNDSNCARCEITSAS